MNVAEAMMAAVAVVALLHAATLPKVPGRSRGADDRDDVVIAAVERLQLFRVEEQFSHLSASSGS